MFQRSPKILWCKNRIGPARQIHGAVKEFELRPGKSNQLENSVESKLGWYRDDVYLIWLRVKSVQEIWIEHFVGEIERISLNIDKGDEHVYHVKRWKLDKLVLQIILHHLPKLETIRRVEVKGAKGLADGTHLGRFKSHMLVH